MSSQMGDVSFTDVKFIIQYVGAKLCAEQWEHILHRSSDHFVNWCQKWFQMTTRSKKMRFWDGVIWLIGFEDRKFWLALEDVIFILHGVQWHKLLSQSPVVTRNGAPGRQCCEGLVATTIGQFEGHEQYKGRVNQQLQTTREFEENFKLKVLYSLFMVREPGIFCDAEGYFTLYSYSIDTDPNWSCGLLNSSRDSTSPAFLYKSGTFIGRLGLQTWSESVEKNSVDFENLDPRLSLKLPSQQTSPLLPESWGISGLAWRHCNALYSDGYLARGCQLWIEQQDPLWLI